MMDIDLEKLSQNKNAEVSIKINKHEDDDDALLRRFKDRWLFIAALLILVMVVIFCAYIAWYSLKINPSLTGIALNGVTGIALGIGGYVLRGKSNN